MGEELLFYVGGQKYHFSRDEIAKGHCEKLREWIRDHPNQKIVINRPKLSFEAILDFHLTGNLHMPVAVCPELFKDELDFWEISHKTLEKCCLTRLSSYFRDKALLKDYRKSGSCLPQKHVSTQKNVFNKSLRKLWNILNYQDNCLETKAYFCLSTCMIILSIFGVAISTLPEFRLKDQPLVAEVTAEPTTTLPPPPDYCKLLYERESVTAALIFPQDTTANTSLKEFERTFIEKIFPEPVHKKIPSLKQTLDRGTSAFFYIEIITTVFFTIEQALLLISGPRLVSHFMNAMNIIEMLLLLASYCRFSLHFLELEYEDNGWSLLLYVQMFRVLRIVRVMRHVTAFKVLNYSISAGKKDLCIIILYIFMGIVIFSNLIFFFELSEDFHSIPDAWWWTLITMTTVGYGDMIPKTIAGKVLGCVCAVSGVIMLSLVIPIFVNTFLFLYQYAELESVNIPAPKKRCTASRTSTSGDTEITVDPE